MAAGAPAGWPKDLVPPVAPDFSVRAVGWLLDRGPAELRTSPLRAHPLALAYLVEHHARAQVDGTREAYRHLRAELGARLGPQALTAVQQALEVAGAQALAQAREVSLVRAALDSAAD